MFQYLLSLHIISENVQESDGGEYVCVVSNVMGNIANKTKLSVLGKKHRHFYHYKNSNKIREHFNKIIKTSMQFV